MTDAVRALLERLTLQEKAALTAGADMWSTVAVERLGIPALVMTDGPNGARGPVLPAGFGGDGQAAPATCVPCGSALGATWDPDLVARIGALVGAQARDQGCQVLLAPTVNLHRSPLGGRNFEAYSEDPLLTGRLAAAYIRGVQGQGVVAAVKHLVANESETERMTMSSVVDERSLRELYLVPFELAVREADVGAVMTAYNRLNGVYCSEHGWLLGRVLREEWGFTGLVLTDWFAVADGPAAVRAGLDLQMPGPGRGLGARLERQVAAGQLDEADLDRAVANLLQLQARVRDAPVTPRAEDEGLVRDAAAASMVLLRNDGLLPFDPVRLPTLAVIGPNADRAEIMGGGSAQLTASLLVTPLAALQERWGTTVVHEPGVSTTRASEVLTAEVRVELFTGHDLQGEPALVQDSAGTDLLFFGSPLPAPDFSGRAVTVLHPPTTGDVVLSLTQAGRARVLLDGEVVLDGTTGRVRPGPSFLGAGSAPLETTLHLEQGRTYDVVLEFSNAGAGLIAGARLGWRPAPPPDLLARAVAAAAVAEAVVLVVGTGHEWESEGFDRESMALPCGQDELVRRVLAVNARTVVVVNAGAPVEMPWCDDAAAVLQTWFGGQQMAAALAEVLVGDREPGGRLPMTVPYRIEDSPSYGNFPAERGELRYSEGLLMGYRGHDTQGRPARFAFGHGLGYTTFALSEVTLDRDTWAPGQTVLLRVGVANTGSRRGSEVVQVYVEPPPCALARPRRELKGFAKIELDSGESGTVEIALDARSFAYWDPGQTDGAEQAARLARDAPWSRPPVGAGAPRGWRVDPGTYVLHVGRSLGELTHVTNLEVLAHW